MAGQSIFDPRRTLEQRRQAVANLFDAVARGGIADTRRMPSDVIDEGPKRTLHRYHAQGDPAGLPVLMVPPLGAQAACFDLRRGCSLAEHFVQQGRPTYLVDYGAIGFADRDLGLEEWVNEIVPAAIMKVSEDAGGQPVNLVGWCMGGLFSLVTAAAHPELPINTVAMVASPFDVSQNPMVGPVRQIGRLTGGLLTETTVRLLGGIPGWIGGPAFKATSLMTYIKKPITLYNRRDDREFLAQVEAVDELMNNMLAYPGRATIQVYQRLVQRNELATGKIQGSDRVVDLADVRVPVMNVAGAGDVLVPKAVAHHVGALLPNSPDVRLPDAPGGHLGVLTGARAATTTWAYIDEFFNTHKETP
jgi:polyhydroxyalkanoate synthase